MVSVSRFALLRASVLISAWSQSLNFTWHPTTRVFYIFGVVCVKFVNRQFIRREVVVSNVLSSQHQVQVD